MQAGREYYVAMCPLKLIPKIFLFDDDEIPADMRAQRSLNRARIPEIARYLVSNPKEWVSPMLPKLFLKRVFHAQVWIDCRKL